MKFVLITDKNGKKRVVNPAHIVMLIARNGGEDWRAGAWVHLSTSSGQKDAFDIDEKEAKDLLGKLM